MKIIHSRILTKLSNIFLIFGIIIIVSFICTINQGNNNHDAKEAIKQPISNCEKEVVSDRTYELHGNRKLVLQVPIEWKQTVYLPPGGKPAWPTIVYRSPEGKDFKVMVSIIIMEGSKNVKDRNNKILTIAEGARRIALKTAKELNVKLKKIESNSVFGYYFSVTDKKPQLPPDEYRYMTQAIIALKDLTMTCSIFTQEENSIVVKQTLYMIKNAHYSRPDAESINVEELRLSYPGKNGH